MARFVFVHGAFQGGWVWQKLARLLEAQGHTVYTPTLAGCGYLADSPASEASLDAYANQIGQFLELEDLYDIILVGHSFSGLIVGTVMMRWSERIHQTIFVDSMIPQTGRSFVDIAGEPFAQMLNQHQRPDNMVQPWPPKVFGIPQDMVPWFESRLRPFPKQSFFSALPVPFDPHKIPTAFITCVETMSPFIRAMAAQAEGFGWPIRTLTTGHCPMIACPEELANLLISLLV